MHSAPLFIYYSSCVTVKVLTHRKQFSIRVKVQPPPSTVTLNCYLIDLEKNGVLHRDKQNYKIISSESLKSQITKIM